MRYAIYFIPALDGALWRFGSGAVGYDSASGRDLPFPGGSELPEEVLAEITAEPRRYGFHGTLKPPFPLADGIVAKELTAAVKAFARKQAPFTIPALDVATLGRFLALVPQAPVVELDRLAADCVVAFEPFRAPLSETDRARRLSKLLTPRQIGYVDRWGYPYVFEEFRFHMTLTGPIADDRTRQSHLEFLRRHYARIAGPLQVDAVALCRQSNRAARFEVLERYAFPLGV